MNRAWGDVNARARGLATRLLRRADIQALAAAPDLAMLAVELTRLGHVVPEDGATPAALELAVRRAASARLRTLERWCIGRPELVTVVFEDEDCRSLRAMLRGAAQNAAPDARMAGLLSTPGLPERALLELARQATPAAVAALLVAWRHPYGSPLLSAATGAHPDLARIEVRLARTFATRALAAGRRGGPRLLAYVRDLIDAENALAALVLADQAGDVTPKDAFVDGGRRVSIEAFERAVATRDVAWLFRGTLLGPVFARAAADPVRLERDVLGARIAVLQQAVRSDPLGPEPFLLYCLRLRAQVLDLQRIIWGVALGAPAAALAARGT